MLKANPAIKGVYDVKTQSFGPGTGRFKAEVAYNGREITRKFLETERGQNHLANISLCSDDAARREVV